jgi:archaellum biogenesis ATPase FlaH
VIEKEELINRVLYLLTTSDKSIRKAIQIKIFNKFFIEDEVSLFIVSEFMDWFRTYDSLPSPKRIFEKHKDSGWGPKLRIRFKTIISLESSENPPSENEFDSYLSELKIYYAKNQFSEKIQNYSEISAKDVKSVDSFSELIRNFGKSFVEISNEIEVFQEGEYSYTTHEVSSNIDKIVQRDLSKEKRFKIGHRTVDNATSGFKYGDLVLILGNINQGKSMVLVNIAYNLWRESHNVLLLTAEMRPEHFDERIYSRASAVDYSKILGGKAMLSTEDVTALGECEKMMRNVKGNNIVTKFLRPTDNIATVEGYINDLRMTHDFIPDVVIVDSLEHISPLYIPAEEKDWQMKGQVISEFKTWAETCINNRGMLVISTHQAKTETNDKKFDDITITDFGRSKIVPEKADYSIYIRTMSELNILNAKLIKARRCPVGLSWSMAVDYSKCLITDTDDSTRSENFITEDD